MTLQVDSWAVQGAPSSAQMARLQLQSASRSGNGIVEPTDMEVTELAVPGGAVDVAAGAAVALGQEAVFQGSYYAFNIGSEQVPINPTDSTGGRSDLIILRVEDPNIDGTPWTHDPATDQLYYFRVIEGVASTETELPANTTGVVLARVDIPVSTATITQDMITDLRTVANPRTETVLLMQRGSSDPDLAGNVRDYFENWPDLVWQVVIPEWATEVQLEGEWINCGYFPDDNASTSGSTDDARGDVRIAIGFGAGGGETDLQTPSSAYNFNQLSPTNGYRVSMGAGGTMAVPASMRGELANVRLQCQGAGSDGDNSGPQGRLRADGSAIFKARVTFNEVPAPTLA